MLPVKSALIMFACCIAVARSDMFRIPKTDLQNPACKYVVAELVRIDQKLFDLTSFSPLLQKFERKYGNDEVEATQNLSAVAGILNLDDFYKDILNQVEKLGNLLPPCLTWGKSYLKFWLQNVFGTILTEQVETYFDL